MMLTVTMTIITRKRAVLQALVEIALIIAVIVVAVPIIVEIVAVALTQVETAQALGVAEIHGQAVALTVAVLQAIGNL